MKIDKKSMGRMIGLLGFLFLTGCGGGSSSSSNTAPEVELYAEESSVIEGMSINLHAKISDADNDTLQYKWVQTIGEKVYLVNRETLNPSFISPEVDKDSNITFRLEIDDGKVSLLSKAEVSINIIDEPKQTRRHEINPSNEVINSDKSLVNIQYTYTRIPIEEMTSGLILNIYWDSSKLEYSQVKDVFTTDYLGTSSIKDDSEDKDTNKETDKYISLIWVNLEEGLWKVPANSPLDLFAIEMKNKKEASGTTILNIKSKVESPGLEFYSKSVIVKL